MPEPIVTAPPATEAPEKSAREIIEDSLTEPTVEATGEPESETPEEGTEAEEIADAITPGEADEPSKVEDEDADVADVLKDDDKPNVQKRIDRLTAEIKALQEENSKIKQGKQPETPKRYTEDQLALAMMKAVEDNDKGLMRDVIAEIQKNTKEDLVKMYTEEKEMGVRAMREINATWQETVSAYDKYADTKVPAIWPGSHKDLNLRDATSMLYRVAMALYASEDPVKAKHYRSNPSGQRLAVADAFAYLLKNKMGSKTASKTKKLEKQLVKERMKKSIPGVGAQGEDEKVPRRAQSDSERLDEVIAERKKYQEERGV